MKKREFNIGQLVRDKFSRMVAVVEEIDETDVDGELVKFYLLSDVVPLSQNYPDRYRCAEELEIV